MPQWEGIPFVIIGLLIFVLTPRLVAWDLRAQDCLHRHMMRWFGLDDAPIARVAENAAYTRYNRVMKSGIGFLLGVLTFAFGVAILLGHVPAH